MCSEPYDSVLMIVANRAEHVQSSANLKAQDNIILYYRLYITLTFFFFFGKPNISLCRCEYDGKPLEVDVAPTKHVHEESAVESFLETNFDTNGTRTRR